MISQTEAADFVETQIPDGVIQASIEWDGKWIFCVYRDDPDEGQLDPFYAVDQETGVLAGYSIVGDADTAGILDAFNAALEHDAMVGDFLAHYGVKGMKWGVRKDRQTSGSSAASQKAEKTLNTVKPLLAMVTPRANLQSKVLQVGQAAAAGMDLKKALNASLVSPMAIAGYAVSAADSGAYRVPGMIAKNAIRGGFPKDPSLSKPNMSVKDLQNKVMKPINPDYPGLGTTNNCLRATYTYEMRRRGYDVAATKTIMASGQTNMTARVMTKSLSTGSKIKNPNAPTGIKSLFINKPPTAKDAFDALSKQPNGSRGDFQMRWGPFMGGHSVAYEIVRGKPVIFDTQSGKTYSTPAELNALVGRAQALSFNRLDNKDLNSMGITAWVKDNPSSKSKR